MTDTTVPLALLVFSVHVVFGCETPPWVLKRADPGSSSGVVSFFNNTVTDSYMVVRWTWRDSSGGFWDTRMRVSLNKDEIVGGGFAYSDRYENELASARWFRTKTDGPIRWKYNTVATPPDSWWMTSVVPRGHNVTWGFKNQITDGSWVFKVGNDTLEPKNIQNVDGWSQGIGPRWRRSSERSKNDAKSARTKREDRSTDDAYDDDEESFFLTIMSTILDYFQVSKIKDLLSKVMSNSSQQFLNRF